MEKVIVIGKMEGHVSKDLYFCIICNVCTYYMLYQTTNSRFIRWHEALPSRFKFKARGWKAQKCCFWAMRYVLWIKVSTNIKIVTIKWKNWFTIIVRLPRIVFVKHVHRYKISGENIFVGSGWTQRYINWNNDTGKPIVLMTLLQHG